MDAFQQFERLYHLNNFKDALSKSRLFPARPELVIIGYLALASTFSTSLLVMNIIFSDNSLFSFISFVTSVVASVFSTVCLIQKIVEFFDEKNERTPFFNQDQLIDAINKRSQDPTNHQQLKKLLGDSLSTTLHSITTSSNAARKLEDEIKESITTIKNELLQRHLLNEIAYQLKNRNQLKPNNSRAIFFKEIVKEYNKQVTENNRQAKEFSKIFKQAGIETDMTPAFDNKPLFIKEDTERH